MELSYDELVIRVKELEKLDETHKLNSKKYEFFFNQSPDAIVIIDPKDASLLEFNDQLCKQLGYTREELSKLKIPDIEAEETYEDTKRRIQSIMEKGSARFETKHRTKSGDIIDVLIIAQYLKLENQNIYHCIWRDIRESKKAEESIKRSKEKLISYLDSSPLGIFVSDMDGNFTDVNPAASKLSGYTIEELTKLKITDIIHPSDLEIALEQIKKVKEKGFSDGIYKGLRKNGEEYWFTATATNINGEQLIAYTRDVTQRIINESKLRESEAQLDNAMKLAKMGNWVMDVATGIFTFTDNFYNIFGTNAEEMGGYTMSIQEYQDKFIHLEDRNAVEKEANFTLQENNPNYNRLSQATVKAPNGSIKNIVIRTFNEFDENNELVRIYGVNQDITELKETEKELLIAKNRAEESESKLLTLFNSMPDLVWLKDVNGRYLSCNHRFEELYGAKEKDIIGKTDYDFVDKETADFFVGNDRKVIESGLTHVNEEILTFASDGHIEYTETIKTPFYGKNREIIGVLGIGRDITDRKLKEEEVKRLNEKYESFISNSTEAVYCLEFEEPIDLSLPIEEQVDNIYKYGYIGHCNLTIAKMYGLETVEDFLNKRVVDIHGGSDNPLNRETFKQFLLNNCKTQDLETEEVGKDGQTIYFLNNDRGVVEDGKLLRIWGTARDITESKKYEQEIKAAKEQAEENERQMHQAQNTAKIGNWVWYIKENKVWWSDEMYNIFDVDKDTFTGDLIKVIAEAIHPDDRAIVEQSNLSVINENKPIPTEYRVVLKNGEEKYVLGLADEIILDENGHSKILTGIVKDITDYKLIQLELLQAIQRAEENEFFLRESQKIGVVGSYMLDFSSGEWTSSEVLDQIFGIDSNITKDIELWESLLYHQDKEMMQNYFSNYVISQKQKFDKEYRIVRQTDGEVRWVYGLGELSFDNKGNLLRMLGTIQDITDRKIVEQELLESKRRAEINERKYKSLFTDMTNGFALHKIILDDNGKPIDYIVTEVNPAYERLTELKAENLINRRIKEVFPDLEDEWMQTTGEVALTGKPLNTEIYSKVVDRYFSVSIFSQEIGYFATFFNDITDRKKAEIELMKAKEKAEESDRLKSAFLCNVSHEIRTPLNAIVGFSALLNDEDLTREDRESFNNIIKSRSTDLLNIINDILDLSQIEANQMKVNISDGKVNELVDDLYKTFTLKKNVENKEHLELIISERLEDDFDLVKTDFHRVKQIISNFLTNAFKFTKHGSIKIGSRLQNNEVVFFVSDTGIGISKDDLPKVFERFRQIEYSDKRSYGGNGLGLSISQGLAELLGGRIWAESELNVGSTFYLSIPYEPVNQIKKQISNDLEVVDHQRKNTILIVEDDQYNLFFLEKLVKSFGYDSISAKNGGTAIEKFRENTNIDLILLDIQLPDISGMELMQIFKTERFEIPIIAQTAFAMEEDKVRILESGCDDYIPKPIIKETLQRKMKHLLI